jgi:hypothetical protein
VEPGSLAALFAEEGKIKFALTPEDSTALRRADIPQSGKEFLMVRLKPFTDRRTVFDSQPPLKL